MQITNPKKAVQVSLKLIKNHYKEHVIGLYLNARNDMIHKEVIGMGTLDACLVHPREVFYPAIKKRCASLIFLHNHPSGSLEFSEDDIEISKRLQHAGKILGIGLTDSIIFNKAGEYKSGNDGNFNYSGLNTGSPVSFNG